MGLRAKKPEAVQKRLKMFMYGPAGVGKSTAALQFERAYIIDTERGCENYAETIAAGGSVLFQTTDMSEVIAEVKGLLTEKHDFRTLVIDPITTAYNDLLDKSEAKVGSEFGRHYGAANKDMKRLTNLVMSLDMNVVVTAHAKKEYAQGTALQVIGQTFDAWKQMDYWFDLVVELSKRGRKRLGSVRKTRIDTFPDEDSFEWSYAEIKKRYEAFAGEGILDREARQVVLAGPDQIREMKELLGLVRLPDGTVDKWFSKAGVELWEDMPADAVAKCLQFVRAKLPAAAAV